jgi:hypothetical protein
MMRELVGYLSTLHDDLLRSRVGSLKRLTVQLEIERVRELIFEQWDKS